MKTLLAALAGVSLMAIATTASAEYTASLGYTKLDVGAPVVAPGAVGPAGPSSLGALTGRLGLNTDSWLGVEIEASTGIGDDTVALPAPATEVSLNFQLGAFVVANYAINENFKVFGRAGYQLVNIDRTRAGVARSDGEGGSAYSVGAQYEFGSNAVRLDYTRYDLGQFDNGSNAYTLSFVRKFSSFPALPFGL